MNSAQGYAISARGPQQNQTPPGNNENEGWEDEDGEYFGYDDNEDVGNGEGFGDYEYEDGERSQYGEYNEGQGFGEEEEVNYVHQRARQPMGRIGRPERFGYPPRQEGRRFNGGYNNENRRQPVAPMGGVNGRFRPAISENASPIVPPIPGMRRFKSRPNYINVLPHFHGMVTEEPYTHLAEFAAICSTIGDENFDQSEVKLRLFQFSLKGRAKQWFITLPANSIHTWDEMQQVFLDEYYSVAKTDDSRIEIRTFQQQTGEPLHEAFTRFKELLRKCPHHQIELWELVKCFVDGLTQEERKYLKSTSNGTLLSNPEEDDWDFLEKMSQSSKSEASASRRAKHPISKSAPDYETKERLASMEKELALLRKGEKKEVAGVKTRFDVCESCGDLGHKAISCPLQDGRQEEVNQVFGDRKPYDANSNSYHPSSRNHPNFKYGDASNQLNPNFQGSNQGTSSYQPRQQGNYNSGGYQRSSYNNNRNKNYPPRNYNQDHQQQGGSSGGDDAVNSKLDALLEMMKESKRENEMRDKSFVALERQVGQMAEEISLLKQNEGKLPVDNTLKPQHHVSAIDVAHGNEEGEEEEIKCGEPLVPIQIGDIKTKLALLDYGEGVSILPGSVYDQYNFGPLEEYNTTLVLANATCTRPRGKLVGLAVNIGEFYYPGDFLVLDYAPLAKEEPRVILGRPFLATANAQINCRTGTVDMTFGKRKLNINIFSNSFTYSVENKCSKAVTTNVGHPRAKANEGDTKNKGIMFDRFNVKDEPKAIEKKTEGLKDEKKQPDHVQHPNEKVDLCDVKFTRDESWSWSDKNRSGEGASGSNFVFQPP
ncbi:hypothetical protein L1987_34368 [Smallanthus sonchifolius]|uniref:Uncharacterized protein n=1 Tax=Smallanthus sonchifolius TaxID=185202 RepID=A0ACB9HUH1_9ASTR|nr:hypothetical protein L1987_34368 [Smallanthus sonchifolius]